MFANQLTERDWKEAYLTGEVGGLGRIDYSIRLEGSQGSPGLQRLSFHRFWKVEDTAEKRAALK